MLPQVSSLTRLLQYGTTAGFCLLAAACVLRWIRFRGRVRAYLALAVSLLALVAVLGELGRLTDYRYRFLFDLSLVAFIASGYFLLMFRHEFVPLHRGARAFATVVVVGASAVALAARLPYAESPRYTGAQNTVILVLVLVWTCCVLEPIARFWIASNRQPAVQRARLRSLSIGYGGIILILLVSVAIDPRQGSPVAVAIQVITLGLIPLLFASFAPPRWLRRVWREQEEENLDLARELLMFAEDGKALAERSLHWAMRLVGAGAGFMCDEQGRLLASSGIGDEEMDRIARKDGGDSEGHIMRLDDDALRYVITVPVRSERGTTTLFVVSGSFTPLFGSDEVERLRQHAVIIGVALDRVHLTEELRRLDMARREFLANAAHELRSPLTTIVGISSTLSNRRSVLPQEKWAAGIEAVNRQGQRMRLLVNNLLDLSQMEQGRLNVEFKPVGLAAAAQTTLETSPPPDGKSVDVAIEPNLTVVADPMRLDQILTNLLTNAYRYGGDRISVEAWDRSGDIVLIVSDDGPGVAPELVPHVFDPFARGTDGKKEGSGLGLAIVRRLAEAFGGDVTYEPRRPQGARFLLHLRRAA